MSPSQPAQRPATSGSRAATYCPYFATYSLVDGIDARLCLAFKAHEVREANELREVLAAGADIRDRRGRAQYPSDPHLSARQYNLLAAAYWLE
jgi:hypothetical protein